MLGRIARGTTSALAVAALATGIPTAVFADPPSGPPGHHKSPTAHVLLISVDGLHQSDLEWYVRAHPRLGAGKAGGRRRRVHRRTDADPVGFVPGHGCAGDRRQSAYGGRLLRRRVQATRCCLRERPPAGAGPPEGKSSTTPRTTSTRNALDAGQGLTGLPNSILEMTGQPQTLLSAATLPVDPQSCKPIYPHEYLKVNTIFEVAHEQGLRNGLVGQAPGIRSSGRAVGDWHRRPVSRRRSTAKRSNRTAPPTKAD